MIYQIELTVRTETALHIGTAPEGSTDSLFRRDGTGQLVMPGTSIAGALRGHLTRLGQHFFGPCEALKPESKRAKRPCRCPICHLFGELQPDNIARTGTLDRETFRQLIDPDDNPFNFAVGTELETMSDEAFRWLIGRASRLIVHDAVIPIDQLTKVRDGVGIDRETGAASRQNRAKYDYEVVPAGVEFPILLELEDADETDAKLLQLGLEELHAGRVRMGGHTGRGLGMFSITAADYRVSDPSSDTQDFMNYIRGNGFSAMEPFPSADFAVQAVETTAQLPNWVRFDIVMQVDGFFLTNDLTAAIEQGFNSLSKTLLPGASIRGVLRSHAETIARTIASLEHGDDFLLHNPASNIMAVSRDPNTTLPLQSTASRLEHKRDVLRKIMENPQKHLKNYLDLADRLFGSSLQGSCLQVSDGVLLDDPVWKPLDFVAIDRFTGGSADQKKFDAMALWNPRFQFSLQLETTQEQAWELGWLLLVLRDLQQGLLRLGAGGSKGFGHAASAGVVMTTGTLHPEAALLHLPTTQIGIWHTSTPIDLTELPPEEFGTLQQLFKDAVHGFNVPSDIPYNADSYTAELQQLYPQVKVKRKND